MCGLFGALPTLSGTAIDLAGVDSPSMQKLPANGGMIG